MPPARLFFSASSVSLVTSAAELHFIHEDAERQTQELMARNRVRRTVLGIIVAALLAAPLAAQQAAQQATLTLQQAVAAALQNNPAEKLAAAGVRAADVQLRMASTPLLPQVYFSEGVTGGDDAVYAFGTKLRQQDFSSADFSLDRLNHPAPLQNFSTSINGRWTAFDSRQTRLQMRRALLLKKSVASSAGRTSQEIIFRTVSAYESVLIASRELEVARHAEETAQALFELSKNRVNAGLTVDSDALSAQVNLAQRKQDELQAEGAHQTAWAELEAAVGISLPQGPETLEPLSEHLFTPAALAEEMDQGLHNRGELASLALQTSAQKTMLQAARWAYGPQVNVFGSWQTDRQSFAGSGGEGWMAGAELRVDLLPLAKRLQVEQAQAALQSPQAGEAAVRNQVRLEVSRAYYGLQSAAKMVEVARSSTAQATESLRILRNRYDAGLVSVNGCAARRRCRAAEPERLLAGCVSQRVELRSSPFGNREP